MHFISGCVYILQEILNKPRVEAEVQVSSETTSNGCQTECDKAHSGCQTERCVTNVECQTTLVEVCHKGVIARSECKDAFVQAATISCSQLIQASPKCKQLFS